ncbi:esterase/lipase family protein [Actinoplanes subglobosus]|uniref:Esterase/lipase family protein n=1 Tax=Actinoplanes subglobosus TaxID=1547892 RepID=A0ABV8IVG6_9ACTN
MARLRHLVVVLPGIGGSELAGPEPAVEQVRYGLTASALVGAVASPARLDLARSPRLEPVKLVKDLSILPPLLTLPGYQRIRLHLYNAFPDAVIDTYRPGKVDPRTDVLLVPYDFRRSVADAAIRVHEAVEEALSHRLSRDDRPVIVLAHSMGGLVARYWVGVLEGWRRCRALITLGTPARGAPKALDWLINGAGAGRLRDPRMTRVIRGWPSMYELLPQYPAVWDAEAAAPMELTTLPASMVDADPGLAAYAETFAGMAADARAVHERLRDGWSALEAAQRPDVVPYFARGHGTPNLATVDDGRLTVSKEDPPWRGNAGWAGDGTVPALCAIPVELGESPKDWRPVAARHGPMGSIADPVDVLRSYAGEPIPTRGGELPDRPWLGLDLEDFAVAGEPEPLTVNVLPAPLAADRVRMSVTPIGGGPRQVRDLLPDPNCPAGTRWRGELPPLPAGSYDVTVEAGVDLTAQAQVVVLDPQVGETR